MAKESPPYVIGRPYVGIRIWPHHGIHQVGFMVRLMLTSTKRFIFSLSLCLLTHEIKASVAFDLPRKLNP